MKDEWMNENHSIIQASYHAAMLSFCGIQQKK